MAISEWMVASSATLTLFFRSNSHADSQPIITILPGLILVLNLVFLILEYQIHIPSDWKLRKNNGHGLWCCFLLPLAYSSQVFQHSVTDSYINCLIYSLALSCSLIAFILTHLLLKITTFKSLILQEICLSVFCYFKFIDYKMACACAMALPCFIYIFLKMVMDFKSSFTIGEAAFLSQGITIFMVKSLFSMISQAANWMRKPAQPNYALDNDLKIITDIVMIGGTGCFIIVLLFQQFGRRNLLQICLMTFLVYVFPLLFIMQQFAFIWVYGFILTSPIRIGLMASWAGLAVISIAFVSINSLKLRKTVLRKFFHLVVILVYTPGVICDPTLLYFASCVALFLFILVECIRTSEDSESAKIIQKSFDKFLDDKDQGFLVLTHIYLLIGCSSPLWLLPRFTFSSCIIGLSGIISLGIGDTCASFFGSSIGRFNWPGTSKTVEGTIFAVLFMAMFVCTLVMYGGATITNDQIPWIGCGTLLTALLEATTDQVDNLVLPLFMFLFL